MSAAAYDIRIAAGGRLLVDTHAFPLEAGAVTFLFGESGIGKSLIGKTLFGILDPAEFRAEVNGEPYALWRESPAAAEARSGGFFVFQEPSTHLNPLATLAAQLGEGTLRRAADPLAAAAELFPGGEGGALPRILPVYPGPHRPSGGEKQRILVSMAFTRMDIALAAGEPARGLYVFDEPTGSLDRDARDRFLDRLFARFRLRHETVLLVTHDYGMIAYVRSRHRDLEGRFRFLELTASGGAARTRTFEPGRFLSWLDAQRPEQAPGTGAPVLRVESGISVYGRTLAFARPAGPAGPAALSVRPGELVYMKAGSGVGKTTVAKIVIGLEQAAHFRIEVDGVRLGEVSPRRFWRKRLWGKKMTMAFQHADEALNPKASVAATLRILSLPSLRGKAALRSSLGRLFDADELDALLGRKVWQLSGGQKQRLNLLRALALGTPLVILDEPLSALDFESIDRVLGILRDVRERGTAILLISHNEDIFDRIVSPSSVYLLSSVAAS